MFEIQEYRTQMPKLQAHIPELETQIQELQAHASRGSHRHARSLCAAVRAMRDRSCLCNGIVEQLGLTTSMNRVQQAAQSRCGLEVPGCPVMYPIPPASAEDAWPPIVTLNGAAVVSVGLREVFVDPGATAFDQVEGDVTFRVARTGFVDAGRPGVYTLSYSATDSAGNVSIERDWPIAGRADREPDRLDDEDALVRHPFFSRAELCWEIMFRIFCV